MVMVMMAMAYGDDDDEMMVGLSSLLADSDKIVGLRKYIKYIPLKNMINYLTISNNLL